MRFRITPLDTVPPVLSPHIDFYEPGLALMKIWGSLNNLLSLLMVNKVFSVCNTNSNGCMEMDYGADKEQGPTLEDEFKLTGID